MRGKQRRRFVTDSDASTSGRYVLSWQQDESDVVNVHGMHCTIDLEPENAGANSNGGWAMFVLPGDVIQGTDLPATMIAQGTEDWNSYIWGTGTYTCSNESPQHIEFSPNTSRNIPAGGRIVLAIYVDGLSAGNIRVNRMFTFFTSS